MMDIPEHLTKEDPNLLEQFTKDDTSEDPKPVPEQLEKEEENTEDNTIEDNYEEWCSKLSQSIV
jgi:hemerythrin-like domain-containing protein